MQFGESHRWSPFLLSELNVITSFKAPLIRAIALGSNKGQLWVFKWDLPLFFKLYSKGICQVKLLSTFPLTADLCGWFKAQVMHGHPPFRPKCFWLHVCSAMQNAHIEMYRNAILLSGKFTISGKVLLGKCLLACSLPRWFTPFMGGMERTK